LWEYLENKFQIRWRLSALLCLCVLIVVEGKIALYPVARWLGRGGGLSSFSSSSSRSQNSLTRYVGHGHRDTSSEESYVGPFDKEYEKVEREVEGRRKAVKPNYQYGFRGTKLN
jgi:hypothetical protein